MENRKSIGLPGGPNEFLKEITQHISVEGYKRYSKDVNNPYNIIESGNITMEDVDFPVKGTDNLGNEQMMMPGMNYQFPGDQVFEVPMAQAGKELIGDGGWLPETVVNRFAMSQDEKDYRVKERAALSKYQKDIKDAEDLGQLYPDRVQALKQLAEENYMKNRGPAYVNPRTAEPQPELRPYESPSATRQIVNRMANPITALGYAARGEMQPDLITRGNNAYDYIADFRNPFSLGEAAYDAAASYREDDYLGMGLNALGAIPALPFSGKQAKAAISSINKGRGMLDNAIQNTYKVNPWAFKPKSNMFYRQIGEPGFQDAIQEGKVFAKGQKEFLEIKPDFNYVDDYNEAIQFQERSGGFNLKKPGVAPFFQKDELFFPISNKTGFGRGKTKASDVTYLLEGKIPDEAILPRYRDQYLSKDEFLGNVVGNNNVGVLKPEYNDLSNFTLYKKNWLKGYKEIPNKQPKQYGGEETNPSFDSWYSRYAKATGNSTNPYDKEHYYDYESFFNDNISKPENLYPLDTRDWHLSSKYKKEGHPRLYEYPDGTYGENYIEGAKDTREFQKGGNVRYTSNPNDRGIKAYADSLDLYNGYMDMYNQALNTNAGTREQVARRYNIEQDPTASHLFHLAGTNLGSGKQYMWAHNTNDVNPNILPIAARSYADESNARTSPFTAEYKKPVQPVKYRDPEVVAKQQQLIDSGYDIGAADGIWGPKSQAAWEQTQKEIVNLKPNVVEPTTKKEYSRFVNIHGKNYGFNNQEEFFNIAKSKNMPKGWAEANVPKNLEFQKGGEDITKKGFDWGGYFSGEQGWIPDYDGVPTLQMFDEQPVKQEVVEKKPEILTAAYLENYLAESRGRTPDFWRHSADTIAFHESGPLQRMDPQAIQKSYTKDGVKYDGPGRGMFQFENGEAGGQESFQTAQKRYNATAKARGVSPDSEIMNASSPLDLSADQQYALFYANIIQDEKVKLADYANGNMTLTDLWLVGHKKIEKPGNRNAFAASVEEAKKGIIKKQYGGSNLPNYQLKGEVNYNYNWKSADPIEKYRTPIDNTYVNIPLQRFESINNNKKETDSIGEYVPFNVMDMPQMQQAQDNTYVNPYKINKKDIVNLTPEDIEERNTAFKILDREYNDPRDPWVSNAIKNANNFKTGWKDYSNAPEEEIRKLQQELINNGYDVGSTKDDGVFGSKTQAAYSAMVEDKNLDLKSVDRYFGDYSTKNKEEVMQIQNQLIDLGFLPDKELNGKNNLDGKFGPRTKEALLEYNTTLNEEDSSALIFDSIPSTLEDPRCASGMCAILEKNNVQTEALGIKYKDAWDILENMKISKNSEVLFNIYDEPEFANVNQNTSVEELKNITNKVKQRKQTNKSDYKVGDIIGIYWPGSDKHNQTLNSKTFNTHTGFVSDIDEKGNPIITHNVNGKVKQQPYTQLQTSWIARPNEDIKLNTIYDVAGIENISNDLGPILNLENKWGAKISDNRGNQIQNILKRATYNADKIPQILNSSVNNEWLKHATFAITGVESGIGKDDVTPRTLEEAGFNSGIKQLAYKYKGTKPEDVSLGIGKIKYSTLDGFEKEYFNIDSYKDLADDNKSTDLVSYRLTKNYEIFKDYAKQYPELGLSEEDIRNMSILAHNQGNSKLLQIGKNATSFLLPAEQVKELRKLYEGTINDVSSTNYKYIPGGEKIYNAALAIGAEDEAIPYIRKVNDYINQVFQPMSSTAIASVSSAQKQDPFSKQSLAKGGEYGVFNNYINGDYNNTLREAAAEKVYDKLNRLHYKDAKALGMSPANYILTHVMAKA